LVSTKIKYGALLDRVLELGILLPHVPMLVVKMPDESKNAELFERLVLKATDSMIVTNCTNPIIRLAWLPYETTSTAKAKP
jgi:hypothetical protein